VGEEESEGLAAKTEVEGKGEMTTLVGRPKIDKSRIHTDFWEFGPVKVAENWLQDYLLKTGRFDEICVHEGAHLYYARQLYPAVKIIAPYVSYNAATRHYEPTEAGIDITGIDRKCDASRLLLFVKGIRAGGTAELVRRLLDSGVSFEQMHDNLGDTDDLKDFPRYCKEIRDASPGLVFDDTKIWADAQAAIIMDLFTPETKTKIDAAVDEVRSFLLSAMYPETPSIASSSVDSSKS
jgi:hypothetical protein